MRKVALLLTVLLVAFSCYATETDVELEVYSIVDQYWQTIDARSEAAQGNTRNYMNSVNKMDRQIDQLARYLDQNPDRIDEYVEVFNALPKETKHIFNELNRDLSASRGEELFPGYGYAEPGYYYRRGAEVDVEMLSQFWKTEERTFEKNYRYKFYVELSVSEQMQQNAEAGGNIEGFDVKGVYGMTINGEFKECAEVEFSTKETLRTRCTVMYENNKVWYELYRAEKSFWDFLPWTELTWERCGRTYQIAEEATGTEVIIEAPHF